MDRTRHYHLAQYEKSMPESMTLKEKLLKSKSLGYDFLEMSVDETDEKLARLDWSSEQICDLVAFMQENDYHIHSICFSALRKYCLGSHFEDNRAKALEIMEKCVILAYRLGVRYIQIPGYDVYYEESDELTERLFTENLKKAVDIAAAYGVVLAFETMEPEFMNNVKKAMKYVRLIDSPYLKVYPDSGNCTVAALRYNENIRDDYMTGKGHIIACHLKEVINGQFRQVQFGKGQNDFRLTIQTMHDMGVRLFTTEYWAFNDEWEQRCHYAVKFFRTIMDEIYEAEN